MTISTDHLRSAIKVCNRERKALKELHELNRHDPAPMTGLDMLTTIFVKGFNVDKEEGTALINQLAEEVRDIAARGISPFANGAPRILLTGCPGGIGSEKVVRLLEECGGSVVCFESCSGIKVMEYLVDEDEHRDPMEAIAERYLRIPCSCMSPNKGRLELLGRLIDDYPRGWGWWISPGRHCHTYIVEDELVRRYVRDNFGLPYLQLETGLFHFRHRAVENENFGLLRNAQRELFILMITVGIDVGSSTTKAVLLNGSDWCWVIRPRLQPPARSAGKPLRNCWDGRA